MNPPTTPSGAHDFDFFPGNLQVSHCRLNAAWETNWVMTFTRAG